MRVTSFAGVLVAYAGIAFSANSAASSAETPAKLAATYAEAIEALNAEHARKPEGDEDALAKELPSKAARALEDLLAAKEDEHLADSLVRAGEAALDLARMEDFERVRARLAEAAPDRAGELGTALARPRFLLRGIGGLESSYLEHFAEVLDAILAAYDELFGFAELSKVPGKRLRVRVHLESEITRPPHFAPQFSWHSEIDFPVIDAERLRSPTSDGKFLFYGLCHELGHVIAMWGDTSNDEDHHSWAHYTGVAVVEHLSGENAPERLSEARDVRWRSLSKERERLAAVEPARDSEDGVLSLFVRLHDELGPRAIGAAVNHMDREKSGTRVNRVRYYRLEDLREALEETAASAGDKKLVKQLFPPG